MSSPLFGACRWTSSGALSYLTGLSDTGNSFGMEMQCNSAARAARRFAVKIWIRQARAAGVVGAMLSSIQTASLAA